MNWDFYRIKIVFKKKKEKKQINYSFKQFFFIFLPSALKKLSSLSLSKWKEMVLKLVSHANLKGCRGFKSRERARKFYEVTSRLKPVSSRLKQVESRLMYSLYELGRRLTRWIEQQWNGSGKICHVRLGDIDVCLRPVMDGLLFDISF